MRAARDQDAFALVVGGDCTVGIGTIAGALRDGERLGVVYLDMHADLNIPSSTTDGALDWMGVAHMLAVDGCCPPLRDLGPRTPLLGDDDIVFLGHDVRHATEHERRVIAERGLRGAASAGELEIDPEIAARWALTTLGEHDALAVHFDVDVVNFLSAPLSENIERHDGVNLRAAGIALGVLLADRRTVALTIAELNPDHGEEDGATLRAFLGELVPAVAGRA